jgi:type II secretory ATPase GspE/PulE/Tfp pilus assembly ATPase PilB-like protein
MTAPRLDLKRISVPRAVLNMVPPAVARRAGLLPVGQGNGTLWVVTRGEPSHSTLVQLEARTGLTVRLATVADPATVDVALRRYYPEEAGDEGGALAELRNAVASALQSRSSDIHINPSEHEYRVRIRVDGILRDDHTLGRDVAEELISAVKVQARLDIAEHRIPQDGQITMRVAGEDLSMRVATVPTIRGEKLTLRLLGSGAADEDLTTVESLGMCEAHLSMFRRALATPQGVILLCGPTGSGKTTTLYASLRRLREDGTRHILSIENPVEVPLDGINQIETDAEGERLGFARALRSALRHDPDVLMVGEIRDGESCDIAIKAALTGHLVLSTVHANSAANVTTRLLDMGVSPFLLGSAVLLIVAQRLVRRPCPHCVRHESLGPDALRRLGLDPSIEVSAPVAVGCPYCGQTGYAGRVGLYELLPVDRAVRSLLLDGANEVAISDEVFGRRGLPTLRADGARKVVDGLTTVEEVNRVTYEEDGD